LPEPHRVFCNGKLTSIRWIPLSKRRCAILVKNSTKYGELLLIRLPRLARMIRDCQLSQVESANVGSAACPGLAPVREDATRSLKELMGKWRATLAALVPIGYEDEAGFHYGAEPRHSSN
jgi:hypothetical protein